MIYGPTCCDCGEIFLTETEPVEGAICEPCRNWLLEVTVMADQMERRLQEMGR